MTAILRCPFCGSKSVEERAEDLGRCNKCGHRFWYKIPDHKKHYVYFSDKEMSHEIVEEAIETDTEKIPKGHWLYSVQHKITRERKDVITDNLDAALISMGWSKQKTWSLPICYGGDVKKDLGLEAKIERTERWNKILQEENESYREKEAHIGSLPAFPPTVKPSPELMQALPKEAKKPKARGETSKSQIIAAIVKEPEVGHEKVLEQIFMILKKTAEEKGGNSNIEHLKKRSSMSYYFYKREANGGTK